MLLSGRFQGCSTGAAQSGEVAITERSMMPPTDQQLGLALLTERGKHLLFGNSGDPYAAWLCAEAQDSAVSTERLRLAKSPYRSRTGAFVITGLPLVTRILTDPRLTCETPALDTALPAFTLTRAAESFAAPGGSTAETAAETASAAGAEFDLMTAVIRPIAAGILGAQLGIPRERWNRFGELCADAGRALDAAVCPPRLPDALALIAAVRGLRVLLPEPDTLAIAVTGVELATNLLAGAVRALLDQPGRWQELSARFASAADVIEQTLRAEPPVRLETRVAHEALDLAGVLVPAQSQVVVLIEAANVGTGAVVARLLAPRMADALYALAVELPDLRTTGPVVHRPRSPVTHAIARFPAAR